MAASGEAKTGSMHYELFIMRRFSSGNSRGV